MVSVPTGEDPITDLSPSPTRILLLLSPWSISGTPAPTIFSKFVAPPNVNVRVLPLVALLSELVKSRVSLPVPPSSLE